MSVPEAQAQLGIGRNLIWRLINDGTIRTVRAGRRVLVPVGAIEEFLAGSQFD